jgi:hypothetical protein
MATEAQVQVGEAEPAKSLAAVAAPALEPSPAADAPTRVEEPKKDSKRAKKPKAPKRTKGASSDEAGSDGPSVASHPRAAHQVARAKSWAGLVGFVLGGYLSMPTHTFTETGLRALAAGVVCYLFAWAAAVFVWRHLVVLEIKGREQELLAATYSTHADQAGLSAVQPPAEHARARTASQG